MTYFSEKELGERRRDMELIDEGAWGGIQALVCARIMDGSFGTSFPDPCPDGAGPVATDQASLWQAMRSENFQIFRSALGTSRPTSRRPLLIFST